MSLSHSEGLASPKRPHASKKLLITRWIVAGPLALVVSVLVMAGMSVWLPEGNAGIDHLAFPLILFPAIWSLIFFYALLENSPTRAGLVILAVGAINAVPVIQAVVAMSTRVAG